MGSSPRVWGQGRRKSERPIRYRIIPTRVGTRSKRIVLLLYPKDHPHACGDKRSMREAGTMRSRIIPTRVGTSLYFPCNAGGVWDHPHACGDKLHEGRQGIPAQGSSPRVWGQADLCLFLFQSFRIIPTRVGTRRENIYTAEEPRDHPHACGDKTKEIKENSGFAKSTA